jgi:hypothetical protein
VPERENVLNELGKTKEKCQREQSSWIDSGKVWKSAERGDLLNSLVQNMEELQKEKTSRITCLKDC